MNNPKMHDDEFFKTVASRAEEATGDLRAPSRLKARIYSSLVKRQQASGPLLSLTATKASQRRLCVFENLVEILPVGEKAKTFNCCSVCHARLLGEHLERPPIFWGHCPYVGFRD